MLSYNKTWSVLQNLTTSIQLPVSSCPHTWGIHVPPPRVEGTILYLPCDYAAVKRKILIQIDCYKWPIKSDHKHGKSSVFMLPVICLVAVCAHCRIVKFYQLSIVFLWCFSFLVRFCPLCIMIYINRLGMSATISLMHWCLVGPFNYSQF